jgi:hypothetical protein
MPDDSTSHPSESAEERAALVERLAALNRGALDEIDARVAALRRSSGADEAFRELRRIDREKEAEYDENARILTTHLEATWGNDKACPFCGNASWLIDPKLVSIQRADMPTAGIPVFLVMCKRCGFEVHISGELSGVFSVDKDMVERVGE